MVSGTVTIFSLVNHILNDCFAFEVGCLGDKTVVGNGYCDDQTNTEACNFDGGDCCLSQMYFTYCDFCFCHETGITVTASPDGTQV
jgi:hypothetical protein